MRITTTSVRRLQRSLNALQREDRSPRLKVDGWLGRRTLGALIRFLAAREGEGEKRLVRALRALR